MRLSLVALCCLFPLLATSQSSKPLYIRIHETNVFTCPRHAGLTNKKYLTLSRDSIKVTDYYKPGEEVPVIKLPGKYKLEFRNIRVTGKDLDYLIGDMSVKLRAKLYGSPVETEIKVIPSEDPQNPDKKLCDKGGNLFELDPSKDKYTCRHCDLCAQSKDIERDLQSQRVVANQQSFSAQCDHFKQGETYNLVRIIDLPDPDKAKDMITRDVNLLSTIQDAFAQGKGRMLVELRLLTKPKSSLSREEFCQKRCGEKSNYVCWRWNCQPEYEAQLASGRITSSSNGDECVKNQESTELAGCYDIEFSYDASKESPPVEQQPNNLGFSSFGSSGGSSQGGSDRESEDVCKGQPNWCRGCWWCGVEWCSSEACRRAGKRT